jgi:hypothetical protein
MSVRAARWWLFAALALVLPFPGIGPFGGFVPAVRFLILTAVTAAVAVTEGAAGPVPGMLLLFAVQAVGTLLVVLGIAWVVSRALAPLSPGVRRGLVWGAIVVMVVLALVFEPYETSFGRAPTANLLGVLS